MQVRFSVPPFRGTVWHALGCVSSLNLGHLGPCPRWFFLLRRQRARLIQRFLLEVSIQHEGYEQPFVYRGFQMINEEKLQDLRGDQLRKMTKSGMLPLLYAHLFSLSLMREVFARQVRLGKMPQSNMAG